MKTRFLMSLMAVLALAVPARAELTADEVAIVAVAGSEPSRQIAEYYAAARGIPTSRIMLLDVKPTLNLSRTNWDEKVRPAIRAWLAKQGLEGKVRCLVTAWDVPLRVGPRAGDVPVVLERKDYLARTRKAKMAQFDEVLASLDAIAAKEKPAARTPLDPKLSAVRLSIVFETALKEAQARLQEFPPEERKSSEGPFERAFVAGSGTGSLLNMLAKQKDAGKIPAEMLHRLELVAAQLQGIQAGLQALMALPDSVARDDQLVPLIQQVGGLLAVIRWIDEQEQQLHDNETQASFDSELSLLYWPEYPLFRGHTNPLYYAAPPGATRHPALMVSRLAAPTPELVKKLIDASIAVEKSGLEGKVYLDARGLPAEDSPGSYGQYDQSLRDLAARLKRHTKLEVVLDNQAKLFQPGQCPGAALYCGWYSLGSYVDAFTWQRGAVGYHLASMEAETLIGPGSSLWCPAMLERGVAATLGPTFEPYLAAFPLPDDFFPLLLTGRSTLVETYYRTTPLVSWAMVLVGDPLYNPYKNHPQLEPSALPERMKPKPPHAPR